MPSQYRQVSPAKCLVRGTYTPLTYQLPTTSRILHSTQPARRASWRHGQRNSPSTTAPRLAQHIPHLRAPPPISSGVQQVELNDGCNTPILRPPCGETALTCSLPAPVHCAPPSPVRRRRRRRHRRRRRRVAAGADQDVALRSQLHILPPVVRASSQEAQQVRRRRRVRAWRLLRRILERQLCARGPARAALGRRLRG